MGIAEERRVIRNKYGETEEKTLMAPPQIIKTVVNENQKRIRSPQREEREERQYQQQRLHEYNRGANERQRSDGQSLEPGMGENLGAHFHPHKFKKLDSGNYRVAVRGEGAERGYGNRNRDGPHKDWEKDNNARQEVIRERGRDLRYSLREQRNHRSKEVWRRIERPIDAVVPRNRRMKWEPKAKDGGEDELSRLSSHERQGQRQQINLTSKAISDSQRTISDQIAGLDIQHNLIENGSATQDQETEDERRRRIKGKAKEIEGENGSRKLVQFGYLKKPGPIVIREQNFQETPTSARTQLVEELAREDEDIMELDEKLGSDVLGGDLTPLMTDKELEDFDREVAEKDKAQQLIVMNEEEMEEDDLLGDEMGDEYEKIDAISQLTPSPKKRVSDKLHHTLAKKE
ncbi:unnamed protein product [Thlaspi arvense]|uniref:Uncharacterized protein n=1 Tax=Thlaspi arvense TaxID=13288 RepID=A0AAU9TDP0_THLAR|nr:unnamed protein product [Thlaspi arvense]